MTRKSTISDIVRQMEEIKLDSIDGFINSIPVPIQLLLNMPSASVAEFCNIIDTAAVSMNPVEDMARLRLDVLLGHTEFHSVFVLREPISFFAIPEINIFWKALLDDVKLQIIISQLLRHRDKYFRRSDKSSVLHFPRIRDMWINVRRDFRSHFNNTDIDRLKEKVVNARKHY